MSPWTPQGQRRGSRLVHARQNGQPFSDAVLSLKAGEYTHKPIQTQYGWHVISWWRRRDLPAAPLRQCPAAPRAGRQAKKVKAYTDD